MESRKALHEKVKAELQKMGSKSHVKTEESKANKSREDKNIDSPIVEKPELLQISRDSILEIFDVLSSNKSTKAELFAIAEKLEGQGCYLNAKLIRETVSVYENKKL